MKVSLIVFSFFLILIWSDISWADEGDICDQDFYKAEFLIDVGAKARLAKEQICSSNSSVEINEIYINFLNDIRNWFSPYGGFKGDYKFVDVVMDHVSSLNPSVSISMNLNGGLDVEGFNFEQKDEEKCLLVSHADECRDVLSEFVQLHNNVQMLQARKDRLEIEHELNKLYMEWEPFLSGMKGQTWLELLVNGHYYRSELDRFSSPPDSQLILLHPVLLFESISGAKDGESNQEALGIEIIGMNWWRQNKWYIPSGASILAVYSDRAGVKDTGYGLAFHFLSDYTLGYTNHDGESGFFISMDVVKLFQNKKRAFNSYREAFSSKLLQ